MPTQVNEFYGMDNFVHPTPDIMMQDSATAQAFAAADAAIAANYAQSEVPPPVQAEPVQISVSFRDIFTPQESYDPTSMEFKLDMTFIVTVSDMTGKSLESGVVTKRLCLCKQALAAELKCATGVTEEIDLTKAIAAKAQVAIKESAAETQARVVKRMRELAGIPHPSNHV